MKYFPLLFSLLLLTTILPSYSQEFFEGSITYTKTYLTKTQGVNIDSLTKNRDSDSSIYSIKKGYYKNVYFKNGKPTYTYSFDYLSYKMFDVYSNSKIASWRNARTNDGEESKMYIENIDTLIDGYRCDKKICISKDYNYVVYFSKDIKYDTTHFTGHKRADWGKSVALTNGGISVLTINDKGTYYEVTKLTRLEKRTFNNDFFSLPKNIVLGVSSRNVDSKLTINGDINSFYKCLYSNLKYPQLASIDGKEYTAYIKIIINEKGKIEWAEPYEEDSYGFNKMAFSAFNACSKPSFKPSLFNGEKTKVVEYLPVWFKLSK